MKEKNGRILPETSDTVYMKQIIKIANASTANFIAEVKKNSIRIRKVFEIGDKHRIFID